MKFPKCVSGCVGVCGQSENKIGNRKREQGGEEVGAASATLGE